MIGVEQIGQIRRAYFEQGRPIKEIVRDLHVSRNTVRSWLRTATDLYGAVRFGGRSPTGDAADQLRQLATVTADALLRR